MGADQSETLTSTEKIRDLNGRQGGVERGLRKAATDLRPSPGIWRGLPLAPRLLSQIRGREGKYLS